MNVNIVVILLALLAAIGGVVIMDQLSRPEINVLRPVVAEASDPAPDLAFKDIHDVAHNLSGMKGGVVIINFWATWCAPCRIEMPQLFDIARLHPHDITVILVSVDTHKEAVDSFFERASLSGGPNVIIVHDPNKAISKDVFGTVRYPESILIDRGGMMRHKIAGAVDWHSPEIQDKLRPLLENHSQ